MSHPRVVKRAIHVCECVSARTHTYTHEEQQERTSWALVSRLGEIDRHNTPITQRIERTNDTRYCLPGVCVLRVYVRARACARGQRAHEGHALRAARLSHLNSTHLLTSAKTTGSKRAQGARTA